MKLCVHFVCADVTVLFMIVLRVVRHPLTKLLAAHIHMMTG